MTSHADPIQKPKPVPGCDRCGYWERKRQLAEAAGDPSGAIDCRIELRRHKLRHHS